MKRLSPVTTKAWLDWQRETNIRASYMCDLAAHYMNVEVNNMAKKDDGLLVYCPECKLENYAPVVVTGICAWCGYNKNKSK